ncbi:hypothetical protein FKW77_007146 [Venturia effusa]|uniref:Mannosyltransferase n=1 Tax=Venturia effusa TaxID=50376 RepID=A0A517LLQ8_9PEZI|nr:hypothetical protein FKW77_007146 [Venturia effusa]
MSMSSSPPSTRLTQQQHKSSRITSTGSGFPSARHVLLLLVALRIVNALAVKTFYVPDEYYQSLEPAWQLAFGTDSGAWITWEWRNQLRSSLHPILFAGIYRAAAIFSHLCNFSPVARAALLLAAPKITQGAIAAGLDYFTWRLAEKVFGTGSHSAWSTVQNSPHIIIHVAY